MKNNNARKNKLLALLLSGMMTASFAVGFTACSDDDSSSSSSSSSSADSTQKDDGIIKNADFQIFNTNNGLNVISTSVTGWSRKVNSPTSGSALSSKTASGIVDTAKWDELFKSAEGFENETFEGWTEDTAKNKWNSMSVKDKLAYYEFWEENNDDDEKDLDDLSFYQAYNVDHEDVPTCENPKTHDDDKEDTNVLMIHNEYFSSKYENFGTAQKYESSTTVTVRAGTSAKFSVWVKTMDLTSTTTAGDVQPAVDKGAYISITNSLGSSSLSPLEVKNINTENVATNNGWQQFTFYLQGSTYADATFKVVLGLGQSGGTDRSEYVNGYAFFDDIECKTITNDVFKAEVNDNAIDAKVVTHSTEKTDKIVNAADESFDVYAIDFEPAATADAWGVLDGAWDIDTTTERATNGTLYTAADSNKDASVKTYQGLGLTTENDVTDVLTVSEMATNPNDYLKAVYKKNFKESEIVSATDKVLMLLSSNGAAYTAKSNAVAITLQPNEYKAVSFLVKTSALNGFTGANATLTDGTTKTTISSIDTTTIASVDIDDETKDIYEGWQRCYFFLSNETTEEQTATLSFGFGPTTVIGTAKTAYYAGFAAFTDFTVYDFGNDKAAFDLASGDTYTKVVSLEGVDDSAAGDSGFDSPAYIPTDAIETGFANPKNYKGVYFDSDYVAGGNGTGAEINQYASAGLLNQEHADNYTAILEKLGGTGATWDSTIGNDATQPLVIYNDSTDPMKGAYGFIGAAKTVDASSYAVVSLRLKVSKGAKASVYLIDTTEDTRDNALSIGSKAVYWYDEDGNICTKDPSKSNFNKTKDIAFKKVKANGLYKVNPTWEGASSVDATKYYANLSAYEADKETGNLLVGENGVSYNYTSKWLNDGNDGVAFYADEDGKYYANSKKQAADEVLDIAGVTALQPRYVANEKQDLFVTVEGKADTPVWQTVSFYIHTGSVAKNYRLEVWSGTRDNTVVNATGSFVIADSYNPGNADSKFDSLVDLRKEQIDENGDLGSYFETVYSFYDTDAFLRYDESADENEVGDSYEDYRSSNYTEGVAFLQFANGKDFEFYADYSLVEQLVAADEEEVEDEEEEETTTETDAASVWLLAGSIIIAVVLLGAVVSVIVRKTVGKRVRFSKEKNSK